MRLSLRIGASEEGTLRQHTIDPDGSSSDAVWFSIVDGESPWVEEGLKAMLHQPRAD